MSGHSKWATIHRQKEITDAKRGAVWTKITNAIIVAVRETGIGDPDSNFKLRMAMDKGRSANMPNENVKRAIEKGLGAGGNGEQWEEITYEGFGPQGVAVMAEVTTDNNKRSAQEIKNYLEKSGGKLVGPGGVAFQFKRVGMIVINNPGNADETMLKLIDLGAEDVEEAVEVIEVYTMPENLEKVKQAILQAGYQINSFELAYKPTTLVAVSNIDAAQKVLGFIEGLEELSDVQKVFSNLDIPQEVANQIAG